MQCGSPSSSPPGAAEPSPSRTRESGSPRWTRRSRPPASAPSSSGPRIDRVALGYCALIVGRASLAEPEIAYELLPEAQGQGYATEACTALVDAAFATGRSRLWSTVRPWNAPSLRVLDELGFRRDRTTADGDGELIWLVRDR